MAKLKALRQDREKASEGVWVEYAAGVELRIARWGNPRFDEAYAEKMRPHQAALRAGVLPESVKESVLHATIAETILRDWRNVDHPETGAPLPYTAEEGLRVLGDTDYADLLDFVVRVSRDAALYRVQSLADASGN